MQIDADDNPIFECQNCHNSYCMRHKVLWHFGETCDAFELRVQNGVLVGDAEGTGGAAARSAGSNVRASSGAESQLEGQEETEIYARFGSSAQKRRMDLAVDSDSPLTLLHTKLEQIRLQKIEEAQAAEIESVKREAARRKRKDEASRKFAEALAQEDYRQRREEERQGEQTVEANAKRCPKCRWYVQKKDGCEHVSQSSCGGFEIMRATLLSTFIDDLPMSVRILFPLLGRLQEDSSRRKRSSQCWMQSPYVTRCCRGASMEERLIFMVIRSSGKHNYLLKPATYSYTSTRSEERRILSPSKRLLSLLALSLVQLGLLRRVPRNQWLVIVIVQSCILKYFANIGSPCSADQA